MMAVVLYFAVACTCSSAEKVTVTAQKIIEQAGLTGGLVVHVGCGNGVLTAALRRNERIVVHGLDRSEASARAARETFRERGLKPAVAQASCFDGEHLPFVDNLVNLLVVQERASLSQAELMRVLAPGGSAVLCSGGSWRWIRKEYPSGMDGWSHFLHGPGNNAVSKDVHVGFPFHVQWTGLPRHSRDHELATSLHTMVSAGGRLFYIVDEGPRALAYYLPSRWYLVARDAFNGIVLWRHPLAMWQPYHIKGRKSIAADLWRRLVATDSVVYVTEGIFGPVVALNAATGSVERTYAGTGLTEEIIYVQGRLYLVAAADSPAQIDRRALALMRPERRKKRLLALEAQSGNVLWRREDQDTENIQPLTAAVSGGRVYFQNTSAVVCLSAETGQTLWRFPRKSSLRRPGFATPTLVAADGVVLSADRVRSLQALAGKRGGGLCELIALDGETGRRLWSCYCTENVGAGPDLFFAAGLVWVGERPRRALSDYNTGRDLRTGEVKRRFSHGEAWPTWHHHRCYRDKATERYILAGRTGVEFIDLTSGRLTPHHWVRGVCEYGIMPANGLLYVPPDPCACYIESKIHGFHALAPRRKSGEVEVENRLLRGPAAEEAPPAESPFAPSEWPTFRHDNRRSGYLPEVLATDIQLLWRTQLGGKLTTAVCAGDSLYVAQSQQHTLWCLAARTGEAKWRFTAGGRIDSPPSLSGPYVVFGCRDGYVYALRACDGALLWRFLAAPYDQRIVAEGQVESVWPVSGSVLIEGDTVSFVAGRSSDLDGGVVLWKVKLQSGEVLLSRRFSSRAKETGRRVQLYPPYPAEVLPDRELPGMLPDIFSADEENLYLRSVALTRNFAVRKSCYVPHLFSSTGFLEDSWWERSYWIYGVHFYSGARGHSYAKTLFPAGRLLAFDGNDVYGYQDPSLSPEGAGIFRVPKFPVYDRLWRELARRTRARRSRKQAKRKALGKVNLSELKKTFVWKKGIPAHPKAMLLTRKREVIRNTIRRTVKYDTTWWKDVPLYVNAVVLAKNVFVVAGPPRLEEQALQGMLSRAPVDRFPSEGPLKEALESFYGKKGGVLLVVEKKTGSPCAQVRLPSSPVFDGMIAARGRLYCALEDGSVVCYGPK